MDQLTTETHMMTKEDELVLDKPLEVDLNKGGGQALFLFGS